MSELKPFIASNTPVDWVAAYNDLHWLLTLERAARDLGLSLACTRLLKDLYGRQVTDGIYTRPGTNA